MEQSTKINVGIIFGGRSVEHEVSIISAHQAMAALPEKYQAIPIYISKQGRWYGGAALANLDNFQNLPQLLKEAQPIELSANFGVQEISSEAGGLFKKPSRTRIDVMLPVVHGTTVEDGALQGLLELTGIPYTCPNVLSSAIGMDKIVMKAVLKEAGLPIVDYLALTIFQWEEQQQQLLQQIEQLGYPLIIKPANLGSSIGISRAEDKPQLIDAIDLAFTFATRVIVEQAVTPLREINCAVLGNSQEMVCSACEEPQALTEVLSFADKYLSSASKGMSGAKRRLLEGEEQLIAQVEQLAQGTFRALDAFGVCRVDFLVNSHSGQVYVNEINTIPGSLSFYLFEPKGISFEQLLERLIRLALERGRQEQKLTRIYDSNILAQKGFKGKK